MSNLHVSDFPDELRYGMREAALRAHLSLKDWLIAVVERELSDPVLRVRGEVRSAAEFDSGGKVEPLPERLPGSMAGIIEQKEKLDPPLIEDVPVEPCGYSEWSGELGATVTCGLAKHSPKVKHGDWRTE